MTRAIWKGTLCAALLCAGTALAKFTPSAQQQCDFARITAWKAYASCVDTVVTKDAKGVSLGESAAFAKCRHTYFKKWPLFGLKAALLTGSTCTGLRFTDNSDGTVTDNLTGLVWEKKDNLDGLEVPDDPHDADNLYTWSTGSPYAENGSAFTTFLRDPTTGLNVTGFAGANGWRLPTNAELQSIVLDFACTGTFGGATCSCRSTPCIDGTFGPTPSNRYWSAMSYVPNSFDAWNVDFGAGLVSYSLKTNGNYVRAVRGGL